LHAYVKEKHGHFECSFALTVPYTSGWFISTSTAAITLILIYIANGIRFCDQIDYDRVAFSVIQFKGVM